MDGREQGWRPTSCFEDGVESAIQGREGALDREDGDCFTALGEGDLEDLEDLTKGNDKRETVRWLSRCFWIGASTVASKGSLGREVDLAPLPSRSAELYNRVESFDLTRGANIVKGQVLDGITEGKIRAGQSGVANGDGR